MLDFHTACYNRYSGHRAEKCELKPEVNSMHSVVDAPVLDLAASVRFLVDPVGNRTDVVVSWETWDQLMAWLEEADDRAIVREWLPRLQVGPDTSEVLRWDDIADEWDDDPAV